MKSKTMAVLSAVVFLFAFTAAAVAFGGRAEQVPEEKVRQRERTKARLYEELGLTEEQRQQLRDLREENRADRKELYRKLKDKKEQLREELYRDELDPGQVEKIHAEIKELKLELADLRLEGILAVRDVLTPEQFSDLKERFSRLRERKKRTPEGK